MRLLEYVAAKIYLFYLRHDKKDAKAITIFAMLAIYLYYTALIIVLLIDDFPQIDDFFSNKFLYSLHFLLMLTATYFLHRSTWKNYLKTLEDYEQKHKHARYHIWIFFLLPFIVFILYIISISFE